MATLTTCLFKKEINIMAYNAKEDVKNILNASVGAYGANFISDTAAHPSGTGYVFVALQVIADAFISA